MVSRARVPLTITSLRLLSIPFLLIFLNLGEVVPFLVLFSLAVFTDYLDGHLARKFGVATNSGAYFDSLVDFGLVLSILLLIAWKGAIPNWVPSIVVVSFAIFMITSSNKTLIYDPIGKYFGAFLFVWIFLSVLHPEVQSFINVLIVLYFVSSLMSRTIFLFVHSSTCSSPLANDHHPRSLKGVEKEKSEPSPHR